MCTKIQVVTSWKYLAVENSKCAFMDNWFFYLQDKIVSVICAFLFY